MYSDPQKEKFRPWVTTQRLAEDVKEYQANSVPLASYGLDDDDDGHSTPSLRATGLVTSSSSDVLYAANGQSIPLKESSRVLTASYISALPSTVQDYLTQKASFKVPHASTSLPHTRPSVSRQRTRTRAPLFPHAKASPNDVSFRASPAYFALRDRLDAATDPLTAPSTATAVARAAAAMGVPLFADLKEGTQRWKATHTTQKLLPHEAALLEPNSLALSDLRVSVSASLGTHKKVLSVLQVLQGLRDTVQRNFDVVTLQIPGDAPSAPAPNEWCSWLLDNTSPGTGTWTMSLRGSSNTWVSRWLTALAKDPLRTHRAHAAADTATAYGRVPLPAGLPLLAAPPPELLGLMEGVLTNIGHAVRALRAHAHAYGLAPGQMGTGAGMGDTRARATLSAGSEVWGNAARPTTNNSNNNTHYTNLDTNTTNMNTAASSAPPCPPSLALPALCDGLDSLGKLIACTFEAMCARHAVVVSALMEREGRGSKRVGVGAGTDAGMGTGVEMGMGMHVSVHSSEESLDGTSAKTATGTDTGASNRLSLGMGMDVAMGALDVDPDTPILNVRAPETPLYKQSTCTDIHGRIHGSTDTVAHSPLTAMLSARMAAVPPEEDPLPVAASIDVATFHHAHNTLLSPRSARRDTMVTPRAHTHAKTLGMPGTGDRVRDGTTGTSTSTNTVEAVPGTEVHDNFIVGTGAWPSCGSARGAESSPVIDELLLDHPLIPTLVSTHRQALKQEQEVLLRRVSQLEEENARLRAQVEARAQEHVTEVAIAETGSGTIAAIRALETLLAAVGAAGREREAVVRGVGELLSAAVNTHDRASSLEIVGAEEVRIRALRETARLVDQERRRFRAQEFGLIGYESSIEAGEGLGQGIQWNAWGSPVSEEVRGGVRGGVSPQPHADEELVDVCGLSDDEGKEDDVDGKGALAEVRVRENPGSGKSLSSREFVLAGLLLQRHCCDSGHTTGTGTSTSAREGVKMEGFSRTIIGGMDNDINDGTGIHTMPSRVPSRHENLRHGHTGIVSRPSTNHHTNTGTNTGMPHPFNTTSSLAADSSNAHTHTCTPHACISVRGLRKVLKSIIATVVSTREEDTKAVAVAMLDRLGRVLEVAMGGNSTRNNGTGTSATTGTGTGTGTSMRESEGVVGDEDGKFGRRGKTVRMRDGDRVVGSMGKTKEKEKEREKEKDSKDRPKFPIAASSTSESARTITIFLPRGRLLLTSGREHPHHMRRLASPTLLRALLSHYPYSVAPGHCLLSHRALPFPAAAATVAQGSLSAYARPRVNYRQLLDILLSAFLLHGKRASPTDADARPPCFLTSLYLVLRSRVRKTARNFAPTTQPLSGTRTLTTRTTTGRAALAPAQSGTEPFSRPLFRLDSSQTLRPWTETVNSDAKTVSGLHAALLAATDARVRQERSAEEEAERRLCVLTERALVGVVRDVIVGVRDNDGDLPVATRAQLLAYQELLGAMCENGVGGAGVDVLGSICGLLMSEARTHGRAHANSVEEDEEEGGEEGEGGATGHESDIDGGASLLSLLHARCMAPPALAVVEEDDAGSCSGSGSGCASEVEKTEREITAALTSSASATTLSPRASSLPSIHTHAQAHTPTNAQPTHTHSLSQTHTQTHNHRAVLRSTLDHPSPAQLQATVRRVPLSVCAKALLGWTRVHGLPLQVWLDALEALLVHVLRGWGSAHTSDEDQASVALSVVDAALQLLRRDQLVAPLLSSLSEVAKAHVEKGLSPLTVATMSIPVGSPVDALVRAVLARQHAAGHYPHSQPAREGLLRCLCTLLQLQLVLQRTAAQRVGELRHMHARVGVDIAVVVLCASAAYRRWVMSYNATLAHLFSVAVAYNSDKSALSKDQFAQVIAKVDPTLGTEAVSGLLRAATQHNATHAVLTRQYMFFPVSLTPEAENELWQKHVAAVTDASGADTNTGTRAAGIGSSSGSGKTSPAPAPTPVPTSMASTTATTSASSTSSTSSPAAASVALSSDTRDPEPDVCTLYSLLLTCHHQRLGCNAAYGIQRSHALAQGGAAGANAGNNNPLSVQRWSDLAVFAQSVLTMATRLLRGMELAPRPGLLGESVDGVAGNNPGTGSTALTPVNTTSTMSATIVTTSATNTIGMGTSADAKPIPTITNASERLKPISFLCALRLLCNDLAADVHCMLPLRIYRERALKHDPSAAARMSLIASWADSHKAVGTAQERESDEGKELRPLSRPGTQRGTGQGVGVGVWNRGGPQVPYPFTATRIANDK